MNEGPHSPRLESLDVDRMGASSSAALRALAKDRPQHRWST
jgi:hypothetical protein